MRVDQSSARPQVQATKPEVAKAKTEATKMQAAKPEAKPAPQAAKHTRVDLRA
jgi:hypothetical protein